MHPLAVGAEGLARLSGMSSLCPSSSALPHFVIAKGNGEEWMDAGLGSRMNSEGR